MYVEKIKFVCAYTESRQRGWQRKHGHFPQRTPEDR